MSKHNRSQKYAGRARRRFCKGTRFNAPVDLILSGQRTLEEWVAVLNEERELEQATIVREFQAKTVIFLHAKT